jgi:small subunit ribosomal protein S27e
MAGSFLRVECPDCDNEQVVFEKTSSKIACAVCGHVLAHPTGGIATFEGEVVEVVEDRSATPLA